VFARQFWHDTLHSIGLAALALQPIDSSFNAWWDKEVLTGAWTIWKHQNDCLQWSYPRLFMALNRAQEEAVLWSLAGAKGLSVHGAWDGG